MIAVERYSRRGFDIVLTDDRTLVSTNLQVFLLSPTEWNYRKYVEAIRVEAGLGNIKDWNELCTMFKHENKEEMVVRMILVPRSYCS